MSIRPSGIRPEADRNFGRFGDAIDVPPLTDVQTRSYERFLCSTSSGEVTNTGLEGVCMIFPIESYDKKLSLDYLKYELGKPRYDQRIACSRLTLLPSFRAWLQLRKDQPVEEEVYLGRYANERDWRRYSSSMGPSGRGQILHRLPGVDFVIDDSGPGQEGTCRIILDSGSWIEINVTKKDTLGVRIDQSGKFSSMTLLVAMDPTIRPTR